MGFLLAKLGVTCADFPHNPYRGIERLPAPDNFEGELALARAGHDGVWQLWEAYWEADDSGDLATDLAVAQGLCDRFSSNGIDVEVIYAELVDVPVLTPTPSLFETGWRCEDVFARYKRVAEKLLNRPANLTFYGFDLSQPLPTYHSVIRQPGFRALAHRLSSGINQYGLIEDREAARNLLGSANEMSVHRPICVIGVWGIGK